MILFFTVISDAAALTIARHAVATRLRKQWLICAPAADLGVLASFKDANSFIDSARELFALWGFHGTLAIIHL